MNLEYFGLIEQPFGVTPDTRFLHLGPKHREALASLVYETENNRGFVALIAPPGMGKTSLLFHFLEGMRNRARTALLFQTAADSRDLLRYLLADLGIDSSGADVPGMHEMLNQVLADEMRAGRRLLLVIDEAQNLGEDVLESIRLLSNFETPWMKLIQIVLAGQPQLAEHFARPSMAQLRQRISSLIRLDPFTAEETNTYIDHRLWVAGYAGPSLFTVGARLMIAQHSGGIPRTINNLCFHSMALAPAMGRKVVDSRIVSEVVADLSMDFRPVESPQQRLAPVLPHFLAAHSSPVPKGVTRSQRTSSAGRGGRLVPMAATVFALLILGLVSGASWKTDAGSLAPAAHPTQMAAVFQGPMAHIEAAPETPPIQSNARAAIAGTPDNQAESVSPDQPKPEHSIIVVFAARGMTLRHLCLLYLDRFDPPTLAAIRRLNPAISDPNRLQAGQQVRLPGDLRREDQP